MIEYELELILGNALKEPLCQEPKKTICQVRTWFKRDPLAGKREFSPASPLIPNMKSPLIPITTLSTNYTTFVYQYNSIQFNPVLISFPFYTNIQYWHFRSSGVPFHHGRRSQKVFLSLDQTPYLPPRGRKGGLLCIWRRLKRFYCVGRCLELRDTFHL